MKKFTSMVLTLVVTAMMLATPAMAAKTLKLAMDADPVSLDPQVQLSGGRHTHIHLDFRPSLITHM